MKKNLLALILLFLAGLGTAQAYDFSAVAPSGQTLYYAYNSGSSSVSVTYPGLTSGVGWSAGYTLPTGALVIPDSVTYSGYTYAITSIGQQAFQSCYGLTSVTIPSSVTSIGYSAFSGCSGLTSVTIGNSVTSIGGGAFNGCRGLTSVTIPNSVTSIGNGAFADCRGLTITNYTGTLAQWCNINFSSSISNPVYYSHNLYINGTEVTQLVIPNGVTEIKQYAFYGCRGLIGTLTIPNTVTSIGNSAFSYCSGLTSITIPNSVTNIGSYAFSCVRHIEYHGSAIVSPWGAFSMNGFTDGDFVYADSSRTHLSAYIGNGGNVTVPNSATSIGNGSFYYCTGLTSVTIGSSVTSIGDSAFACSGLASVTIPNSVTRIGNYAFAYCHGLTSASIPNSVVSIGYSAFEEIRHIEYHGSATGSSWGACSMNGFTDGDFVYANSSRTHLISYIGNGGNVAIPNSVTHIGSRSFHYCTGLTSVTIPNSVTSIGNYAFKNFTGLTSVTIPNSVTSIGQSVFHGCSGLTSVTIPNSVTSIGDSAFAFCNRLTSVTIPNSVTSIGNYAFAWCPGLGSITIPNSVTSIGDAAFAGCSGLTSVIIPNSVTRISYGAFSDCSGLASVTIPNSVTSIGYSAFEGCSGLTTVTIPNSVTSIGNYAFHGCSGLTGTLTIPNSVTSIGGEAFYRCRGLTSVTIGNSVDSIGDCAFYLCLGLTEITSLSTIAPRLGSAVFDGHNMSSTIPVHIPCGSTSAYSSSSWNNYNFSNFVETLMFSFNATSADSTMGNVVILTRPSCQDSTAVFEAVPNSGFHFANWSDGDTANPRTLIVTCDTTVTAVFAVNQYTVTLEVNDPLMGAVTGASVYNHGDTATLHAEAFPGYHFSHWNDGDTTNPRTLLVTCDTTVTAVFAANQYMVTMEVNDTLMGHVTGAGVYTHGDTATLYAEAFPGYHFTYWDDGDTANPRILVVTQDTTIVAFFGEDNGTTAIREAEGDHDGFRVFVDGKQLVVEGAEGRPVMLYDATGRLLATRQEQSDRACFDVPVSGTYLVRIGNLPARKVVVIR